MSKAKTVLGKDLIIMSDSKSIALSTSCKLSLSGEKMDISSKDSGIWTDAIIGKLSWNMSSDNAFSADANINGYDALFDKWIAGEPIEVVFGLKTAADQKLDEIPESGWATPTNGFKGNALITGLELNGSTGDKATFTVTFEGVGKLEKLKPAV